MHADVNRRALRITRTPGARLFLCVGRSRIDQSVRRVWSSNMHLIQYLARRVSYNDQSPRRCPCNMGSETEELGCRSANPKSASLLAPSNEEKATANPSKHLSLTAITIATIRSNITFASSSLGFGISSPRAIVSLFLSSHLTDAPRGERDALINSLVPTRFSTQENTFRRAKRRAFRDALIHKKKKKKREMEKDSRAIFANRISKIGGRR